MIDRLAAWIAGRARWFLVAGLVAGLGWPALAFALQPWIAPMVAASLALTLLRQMRALPRTGLTQAALRAVFWQGAVPLVAALLLVALGLGLAPLALGIVLILSASPITGAAPIAVMIGAQGGAALRQTVVGTALLPLTLVPAFLVLPALGDPRAVAGIALTMLGLIALAWALAWAIDRHLAWHDAATTRTRIDAAQAVVLALVVIGLMGGAGQALRSAPGQVLALLALVGALAFGLQAVALARGRGTPDAPALAICAGNRNAALLLGALPADLVAQVLTVVGLYQIPMYVTPMVLPWVARRLGAPIAASPDR